MGFVILQMILIVKLTQGAVSAQSVRVERLGKNESGRERVSIQGAGWKTTAEVGMKALVGFASDVAVPLFCAERGLVPERELLPSRHLWLVRDASGRRDGLALADALGGVKGVLSVEADYYFSRTPMSMPVPPDDPKYLGQWYLSRIDIERAWARTTGSSGVTIQIIDNGCDVTHPDLAPHLLPGRDVVDGDDDPSPKETGSGANHGTACAGIIGAVGNNAKDIAGTCPECMVRCVRLLGEGELVPLSADVDAMRFALEHPDVAVVSNSWAFTTPMPVPSALKMAIEDVSHHGHGGKGALVVFAAGNENRELQPGELYSMPEVVTVGAINNFDEAAPFSNHGAEVDLTAPTGSLTLDLQGDAGKSPGDTTSLFGGTSAACPVVAGVAALLYSAKEDATADEVRTALIASARRAPFAQPNADGHDSLYGFGIVDPAAALSLLMGPPPSSAASDTLGPGAGCGCSEATGPGALAFVVISSFLRRRHHHAKQ